MDSENKSLVDTMFDSWGNLSLAGKLLVGGTALIWIIWMFWLAVAPNFIQPSPESEGNNSFLPAITESDTSIDALSTNQTLEVEADSEVYLPAITDEPTDEPILVVVNEANASSASEDAEEIVKNPDETNEGVMFTIDPVNSVASYSAVEEFFGDSGLVVGRNTNEGLNTAVGETRGLSGSFELDMTKGSPRILGGEFSADLLQLTSVQPHRDKTIKRFWLESNKYPTATFEITELPTLPPAYAEGSPAVFPLTGLLTVRDIQKEVTFNVTATLQNGVLQALATTDLMFEDFDIDPPSMANVLSVEPSFSIIVSITAVSE